MQATRKARVSDITSPVTPLAGHSERNRVEAGDGVSPIKPLKQRQDDGAANLTLPPGATGTLQRTLQV